MSNLYFNGKRIDKPSITDNERGIIEQLADESNEFGDVGASGFISTTPDPDDECPHGGYHRVKLLKWDGGRRALDGVLSSLMKKNIIFIEDDDSHPEVGNGIWYDIDALKEIAAGH